MNKSDITRDYCMLRGSLARRGYDWWWHSFTAEHAVTGARKSFYIEYFLCNPALAGEEPVLVWNDPEGGQASLLLHGKRGLLGEGKGTAAPLFPLEQSFRSSGPAPQSEGGGLYLYRDPHGGQRPGDAGGGGRPS